MLRITSHRAGDKLKRLFDVPKLDWYWTLRHGGTFALVADQDVARACEIKRVTRVRVKWADLSRCWPSSYSVGSTESGQEQTTE